MTKRVRYPFISFVVARSEPDHVIGCEDKLPWHIRSDLQRFRKITTGHAIIMGRKTFESIGRPLPKRVNIVLSREMSSNSDVSVLTRESESLFFASNLDAALFAADLFSILNGRDEIFVVGGEETYRAFFSRVQRVHLTEIYTNGQVQGDAFFRMKFSAREWKIRDEEDVVARDGDDFGSRYILFEHRERRYRYRRLREFYTDQLAKNEWIAHELATHSREIATYENSHQEEFDFAHS